MTEAYDYPDPFLAALGLWQAGWLEDASQRLVATAALRTAIAVAPNLPPEASQIPPVCYRKRFLMAHNPQNGGDMLPFFYEGEIAEGVASWSTSYDYCKFIFKTDRRLAAKMVIFKRAPRPEEVVLNVAALWTRPDFATAVQAYADRAGAGHAGLIHFRDTQFEVILDAPLTLDDLQAFCDAVPSLEHLSQEAGITTPEDEDDLWNRMVRADYIPTTDFWLEGAAAQKVLNNTITAIGKQLDELGIRRR